MTPWSQEQLDALIACIKGGLTSTATCAKLGMTRSAVCKKAERIGLHFGRPVPDGYVVRPVSRTNPAAWTEEQDQILADNWQTCSDRELAEMVSTAGPPRTPTSVELRRWSHKFLRQSQAPPRAGKDWPVVAECPIEQDRNFQRAYFRAALEEIERRRMAA